MIHVYMPLYIQYMNISFSLYMYICIDTLRKEVLLVMSEEVRQDFRVSRMAFDTESQDLAI